MATFGELVEVTEDNKRGRAPVDVTEYVNALNVLFAFPAGTRALPVDVGKESVATIRKRFQTALTVMHQDKAAKLIYRNATPGEKPTKLYVKWSAIEPVQGELPAQTPATENVPAPATENAPAPAPEKKSAK